jgi:hypothetical protein
VLLLSKLDHDGDRLGAAHKNAIQALEPEIAVKMKRNQRQTTCAAAK